MKHTDLIENGLATITMFFDIIGFRPKEHYTYDAVKDLEKVVNEVYPQGHKPLTTTYIPFGLYLGKTLIDNIENAEWGGLDEDHIWDIYIEIKQKNDESMRVFPFKKIISFWEDRSNNLTSVIKMCEFVTNYDISDKELMKQFEDKDGWIHFETGDCFRVRPEKLNNLSDNK